MSAVKFEVTVHNSSRRFTIPKHVRDRFEIDDGDSVHLVITSLSGEHLFEGREELRSGPEIYGKAIAKALTPGSKLLIEASHPIRAYRAPSEEAAERLTEGERVSVYVNRYERNNKARAHCLKTYPPICCVCGFDFEKIFGDIGRGFIHVHHLIPISQLGEKYEIDPREHLRPVCPNCHEMLHRKCEPPRSIEELKGILQVQQARLVKASQRGS